MKKLRFTQKLLLFIITLITLFLLVLLYYPQGHLTEVFNPGTSRPTDVLKGKLLIAKQGSPFKDSILAKVVHHYSAHPVEVTVMDIAALKRIDLSGFDALLIMYRWEAGNPPEVVQNFLNKNLDIKNKIVVLTTSWNGLEKIEGLDAITGASIVSDAPMFSDRIIKKVDSVLDAKN